MWNLPLRAIVLGLLVCCSSIRTSSAFGVAFRRLSKVQAVGTLGRSVTRFGHFLQAAAADSTLPATLENEIAGSSGPQRLYPDVDDLTAWLTAYGGYLRAVISPAREEGWQLLSAANATAGSTIASIPKKLCIHADPALMGALLLNATARLMDSLLPSQWRARLAVALLSERVRPDSFFSPYIRNLPFEFWGMPIFFSVAEQRQLQDDAIIDGARTRSRFLAEFTASVLSPLRRSAQDPFSGHAVNADALAWGFAAASSRALRNVSQSSAQQVIKYARDNVIDIVGVEEDVSAKSVMASRSKEAGDSEMTTPFEHEHEAAGAVLIPGIDFAAHSFSPNCAIRDAGDRYVLYATRAVGQGEGLTIDYGALSNQELLQDFGFSMDDNPNDKVTLGISTAVLQEAKAVGRQLALMPPDFRCDLPLQNWQRVWLSCAGIPSSPPVSFDAAISLAPRAGNESTPLAQVDARLLALLRVLHTPHEADLLRHGYDPSLLQRPGSALSATRESQVVLTLIALLLVVLRDSGTELARDLWLLQNSVEDSELAPAAGRTVVDGSQEQPAAVLASSSAHTKKVSVDMECSQILRGILAKSLARLPAGIKIAAHSPAPAPVSFKPASLLPVADQRGSKGKLDGDVGPSSSARQSDVGSEIATLSSPRNSVTNFLLVPGPGGAAAGGGVQQVELRALGAMGASLGPNTREAYRYRIRRKRALADLVLQLTELYELLGGTGISAGAESVVDAVLLLDGGTLEGEKAAEPLSRIDKIRQLLDEGNLRGARDDGITKARAFAAKWPHNL